MASDGEDVAIEVFLDFWVGGVVGLAVEEGEVGGVDGESFFEDGEDAVFFDFPIEAFEDEALPVGTIAEFFEFFGLGVRKRQNFSRSMVKVRSKSAGVPFS